MLYAQIVLGLPVEGPFDYIVPELLRKKIYKGSRVFVNFAGRRKVGFVVRLKHDSSIKKLKEIFSVIDEHPIIDRESLLLTKKLSEYYCCSWGEAIETALPEGIRKGKKTPQIKVDGLRIVNTDNKYSANQDITLVHDLDGVLRWGIYLEKIRDGLNAGASSIILLPDKSAVLKAKELICKELDAKISILYRNVPRELEEWLRIKIGEVDIVIGMRSSIFAPLANLGLIIIDQEQDSAYKQDQVPHYHARQVALMLAKIKKAKLILGSTAPSLESFHLVKRGIAKYIPLSRIKKYPEISIIDIKAEYYRFKPKNLILSKYLEDLIAATINSSGKTLLFLNRKGFATFAFCNNCAKVLRCPRCNVNLTFHFKENILTCHYCNFKMENPKICPSCNSGYIKFSGMGTERIESELSRVFPQAKIKRVDTESNPDLKSADIFISTSAIIAKQASYNFDLVTVLGIDNSLNRVDFRSSEKAFSLLMSLLKLTDRKLLIQTGFPGHHAFKAIAKNDVDIFYSDELRERRQLDLAPFKHLALIKLRSKVEQKAREGSYALFKKLNSKNNKYGVRMLSVNPGQPSKLRGNFYWQILIRSNNPEKATKFLKINLKDFRHSGIIVTVDIDPL